MRDEKELRRKIVRFFFKIESYVVKKPVKSIRDDVKIGKLI